MAHLVLNEQQTQLLNNSKDHKVEFCDPQGRVVGYFKSIEVIEKEIADARQRQAAGGHYFISAEATDYLKSLEQEGSERPSSPAAGT